MSSLKQDNNNSGQEFGLEIGIRQTDELIQLSWGDEKPLTHLIFTDRQAFTIAFKFVDILLSRRDNRIAELEAEISDLKLKNRREKSKRVRNK